jgi:ABC-type Fe3+-hydroxamate transport system substrate-binding protein
VIFTDQMGRQVDIPFPPQRIVSLVPSQTELLYELGLGDRVVGITKFCVHPAEWFRSKTRVGGTKKIHFDRVAALHPDLIIGNKEENERLQIEQLAGQYPVWMSDVRDLDSALQMIRDVGGITNTEARASAIAQNIQSGFDALAAAVAALPRLRAAYFIWRDPWMAAGSDTFIDEMLRLAGFENVFGHWSRYPELSLEQLADAEADCVLLSSEPYPFKEKHLLEISRLCPNAMVRLVDGELFSWYGSRLAQSPGYLGALREGLSEARG